MLLHPSFLLFFISLIFSIILLISSDTWFMAWLSMEINLVSFLPLMIDKKNKLSIEAGLKYFLTQAIASVVIMGGILMMQFTWLSGMMILSSLFLKMGAAPFHQWLPSMIDGISWEVIFILFIFQKINPMVLCSVMLQDMISTTYLVIFLSSVVGSVGGLLHSSLRKIMAYSSINHGSWILSALLISSSAWIMYFIMYSLILLSLIIMLNYNEFFYLNQMLMSNYKSVKFLSEFSLLSLGGLPPFAGFIPKLVLSLELVSSNALFLLSILLLGTFISLFFYMRMILINILTPGMSNNHFQTKSSSSNLINSVNMMLLLSPTIFFMII